MSPPDTSRLQVPDERWKAAQEWESSVWLNEARGIRGRLRGLLARVGLLEHRLARPLLGDDWNLWWYERFDRYAALPSTLDNVIEIGCGPYTNVRLIRRNRSIRRLVCSDPLIRKYVALRGTWVAEAARNGEILIDDHPAEELPFRDGSFELTVMINVLDHVRDADGVVNEAIRVTKRGGLLVLGQDLTNEDDIRHIGEDLGHPIRLAHEDLDARLHDFSPLLRKVLRREEGRNPDAHYGTYLFIGRRSAGTSTGSA